MKKNLQVIVVALLSLTIFMTSCKKESTTKNSDDTNTDLAVHSEDQARVDAETDAVANDADLATENYASFSGRPTAANSNNNNVICDATVVLDSTPAIRRITITYNGTNCNGTRTRTGVVTLSMPILTHWRDINAVLTVSAANLTVTRISDGKSITINGTKTITNVSGGRLIDLPAAGPGATRVHDIASSGITVTFDNGTTRIWQIAKRRTFTYDNGLVITTIGTHTDGNISNISAWGTNRFGNPFVTSITQPMVIRQDCGYRLVEGQVTHQRLIANVVTTFGLDSAGNDVTGCPSGSFYFKTVWTGTNGIVRTIIFPY